jgi:hypothetical protein
MRHLLRTVNSTPLPNITATVQLGVIIRDFIDTALNQNAPTPPLSTRPPSAQRSPLQLPAAKVGSLRAEWKQG